MIDPDRSHMIGGSDAPRIMRGQWRALWREKMGFDQPEDLSDVLAVQMGLWTEPLNRLWYERRSGRRIERVGEFVRHPDPALSFMAANLDGVSAAANGEPAYWDAKHTGKFNPADYVSQFTHCALVIGVRWWVASYFVGNSKWEMTEEPVDPLYADALVAAETEFWGYVERGEEPDDRLAAEDRPPTNTLRRVQLEDSNRSEWPNWGPEMVEHFAVFARTHAAHQAHEIAKREIKTLMPADVGAVSRGRIRVHRDRAGAVRPAIVREGKDHE